MTNVFPVAARSGSVLARIIHRVIAALGRIPDWFIALAARFFPASLFENEYQLPLIDPTIAAYVSAISEHFFPILLVIGLATRFSALALLCMTVVIEIFVYPGAWPTHGVWATCLLVVIARGPGWLSLDHLIARKYQ